MSEQKHWLEVLQGWEKFQVVAWSGLFKKRYYIFEEYIQWGKSCRFAFKDVKKLSFKEVRKEYKKIILSKFKK